MDNIPKPPILKERPGSTYQTETFFGGVKFQHTYQVRDEDGKWHEYDKETKKPTGKVF